MVKELYGSSYKVNIEEIYPFDSKIYYRKYKPFWVDKAKADLKRRGSYKAPSKYDILFSIIRNFPRVRTLDDAPFKILIIYEADQIERVIQQALRRTIEKFHRTCRFILCSESISNIIDPIRSRCVLYKFFILKKQEFLGKIKFICETEGIEITDNALNLIDYYSDGDMNVAINLIQTAAVYKNKITGNLLYEIIKRISPDEVSESLKLAINGNVLQARNLLRDLFSNRGYSGKKILKLYNIFLMNSTLSEEIKKDLAISMSDFDYYLSNPSTEDIQLSCFLSYLSSLNISA
ncbi:MAG: hypothetical protein GF329_00495 [Candidatus Lokiarchaeota archaeon]|nr:hypothetical protein [Candidatus Lokiarchaeota archaeon]